MPKETRFFQFPEVELGRTLVFYAVSVLGAVSLGLLDIYPTGERPQFDTAPVPVELAAAAGNLGE